MDDEKDYGGTLRSQELYEFAARALDAQCVQAVSEGFLVDALRWAADSLTIRATLANSVKTGSTLDGLGRTIDMIATWLPDEALRTNEMFTAAITEYHEIALSFFETDSSQLQYGATLVSTAKGLSRHGRHYEAEIAVDIAETILMKHAFYEREDILLPALVDIAAIRFFSELAQAGEISEDEVKGNVEANLGQREKASGWRKQVFRRRELIARCHAVDVELPYDLLDEYIAEHSAFPGVGKTQDGC